MQSQNREKGVRLLFFILAPSSFLLLSCGCGSGGKPVNVARLEGAVTLDARPIVEGNLQFVPQEPGQGSPVGVPIKDGRYVAPAVPQGKVRVVVSATRKTGKMISVYSEPYEEVVSIIPDKYQDGIEIAVSGDDPNRNFALKSR
jgi:hypothetical protein